MKLCDRALSALYRLPPSSDLLANLSVVETDRNASIELRLERVLQGFLRRKVAVIPVNVSAGHLREKAGTDDGWSTDRRAVYAWLEQVKGDVVATAKLNKLFGSALNVPRRIVALVPILSSTGARVATVVVGKRRFLPLVAAERELITAAIGMATLLLHQVQSRNALASTAAQTAAVQGIVETHRQVVKRYLRIDERGLN